ncbi:MAG: hypothetical protein HPY50_03065 [Firmicutes bacterium]|nr:hypothetical protein [Bacillota bacterium]
MAHKKSFIVLGNYLRQRGNEAIEILDGYTLKKADSKQIKAIKKVFSKHSLGTDFLLISRESKREIKQEKRRKGYSAYYYRLKDEELFNYWVIESNNNRMSDDVEFSLLLLKKHVWLLFEFDKNGVPIQKKYLLDIFITDYLGNDKDLRITIENEDISDLKKNYENIKKLKATGLWSILHNNLLQLLRDLDCISSVKLKGIAMVSVIESMLVNQERSDKKISQQFIEKLVILNNELKKSGNEIKPPRNKDTKFSTLMGKLYKFRCDIAHANWTNKNNSPDEYKELGGNFIEINEFIRLLLVSVISFAIEKPTFIEKLKYDNSI